MCNYGQGITVQFQKRTGAGGETQDDFMQLGWAPSTNL